MVVPLLFARRTIDRKPIAAELVGRWWVNDFHLSFIFNRNLLLVGSMSKCLVKLYRACLLIDNANNQTLAIKSSIWKIKFIVASDVSRKYTKASCVSSVEKRKKRNSSNRLTFMITAQWSRIDLFHFNRYDFCRVVICHFKQLEIEIGLG